MNILITGANGFVGGYLEKFLSQKGYVVFRGVRKAKLENDREYGNLEDLKTKRNWGDFFLSIDVVVHCAARVHVMHDASSNPLEEFRKVNVEPTKVLSEQAEQHGVKKFIYLSSIKVNGEEAVGDKPFSEEDKPNPQDPYGVSKLEAEVSLKEQSLRGRMNIIVFRPPLIYGPGVKGNISRLVKLINHLPIIPLGGISNHRSMISLSNLCSVIHRGIVQEVGGRYKLYLVSDGKDYSTSELILNLAKAKNKKVFLLPIPVWLVSTVLNLLGLKNLSLRLFGDLMVSSDLVEKELGWKPIVNMESFSNSCKDI